MSLHNLVLAAGAVALAASASHAAVLYSNDFEAPVGGEWSQLIRDVTPTGARGFLGQFSNDAVTLGLGNLLPHDSVTISFDLYIIRTWDGNAGAGDPAAGIGPDRWSLRNTADGGEENTLLDTTFANADFFTQSYPNAYLGGDNPAYSGSSEQDTLGYDAADFGDSVYRLSFTFAHSNSWIEFTFEGSNLEGIDNETWGIDNIEVSAVPSPGAMGVLGLGGLAMARRRRG
jgi:MYXO-CTERM domain-containing protein